MKNRFETYLNEMFSLKLLSLLVFLNVFSGLAGDSARYKPELHLHGYIKDMQSAYFVDNANSLYTGNLIHNRLNLKWDISEKLYFRCEMRNRLFYGEQVKVTPGFGKLVNNDKGIFNLSRNVVDETSVVLNTLIDRALFNWSHRKLDITIGRQRINWGINLVWNPNDIFNAFNYFDFDYEERPGTDAVRIQYSKGKNSLLDLACKISDKHSEQVAALMYRSNYKKYDWQTFGGVFFQDIVVGTGWAGNIRNTGFKGEVTGFHAYKRFADTFTAWSASISIDRSFKGNYFAMLSYLFSSEGKGLKNGVGDLTGVTLSAKRLSPFRHSFFAQVSKAFNPLVNTSIATIFSPEGNTVILLPVVAYSIKDDWDLSLIGQSFFSQKTNHYGILGNSIFLRLRWSF